MPPRNGEFRRNVATNRVFWSEVASTATFCLQKPNEPKGWMKLDTDHRLWLGQYHEHFSRSIVPRDWNQKQRCQIVYSSFVSVGVTKRSNLEVWGEKRYQWKSYGRAYQNKKRQVSQTRQARRTSGGLCSASRQQGQRKSAHFSSAGKETALLMMKRNRKGQRGKRMGAKRMHIAGRVYDTGHGASGSKATSTWQCTRITLHAGFAKISLSRQNKFGRCWQQRERQAEKTNVKYDWQVSSGNTGWAQRSTD